jgi:hypothetical protein
MLHVIHSNFIKLQCSSPTNQKLSRQTQQKENPQVLHPLLASLVVFGLRTDLFVPPEVHNEWSEHLWMDGHYLKKTLCFHLNGCFILQGQAKALGHKKHAPIKSINIVIYRGVIKYVQSTDWHTLAHVCTPLSTIKRHVLCKE